MAIFGSPASVRAQLARSAAFDSALRYVEDLLRPDSAIRARVAAIADGESAKTDLGDGIFVIEQAYVTKLRADGFFESHRKYIDVQVIVEGEELMEVVDASAITERQPYNPDRDLIVYEDSSRASLLRLYAGQLAVFFPSDVHMPTLRIGPTPVFVRKAVVKVPVSA